MKYFIFIMLLLTTLSCVSNKYSDTNKLVDVVYVTYFKGDFDFSVSMDCNNIKQIQEKGYYTNPLETYPDDIVDTIITDTMIVKRIRELLLKYEITPTKDARIFVKTIINDTIIEFCFGPRFVTEKTTSELNELHYLVKYYSGYYSWFDIDKTFSLIELNDTLLCKKVRCKMGHNQ